MRVTVRAIALALALLVVGCGRARTKPGTGETGAECAGLDYCACAKTAGCSVKADGCICGCDYGCPKGCVCVCGGGKYLGCEKKNPTAPPKEPANRTTMVARQRNVIGATV